MKRTSINTGRLAFYIWVGIAYLLLMVLLDAAGSSLPLYQCLLNEIWRAIYVVILSFIFFEHVLPFIRTRQTAVVLIILLVVVVAVVLFILYSYVLNAWKHLGIRLHLYYTAGSFSSRQAEIGTSFGYGAFSFFVFGTVRHFYNYQQLKLATQQLRIDKQEAELNYLKSQTNPHFLFNTLNNIYALSREKSDLAPESVLRLSQILRFMLYETGGQYIPIEKEIKVIADYIALEQLRYDESLQVDFNYDVEDMKEGLTPLLLVPLVENAFKHGVAETPDSPFVDICLTVHRQQLTFVVRNSTGEDAEEKMIAEHIGLSNLRRQLALLYTDHRFSVVQGKKEFTASLYINLVSHV